MLRRAYPEGTDLRLSVTPEAPVQTDRRAQSRRTLRVLAQGARPSTRRKRHGRTQAVPLWDFSDLNTITGEPVPGRRDPTPTRWSWDFSHYRMAAGDLILERVLDHGEAGRDLPADFGVRLTGENVAAHVARNQTTLADWAAANTELASQIVATTRRPRARSRQAEAPAGRRCCSTPRFSCSCSCRSRSPDSSCWRGCSAATQPWDFCCSRP